MHTFTVNEAKTLITYTKEGEKYCFQRANIGHFSPEAGIFIRISDIGGEVLLDFPTEQERDDAILMLEGLF